MKDRRPVDRILEEWSAVANEARRPATPPRPVVVRSGLSTGTLAGATLIVVALVAAGVLLNRPGPNVVGGGASVSPDASAVAVATPPPSPDATVSPTPSTKATPTALPTPSAATTSRPSARVSPTAGLCDPADLSARITLWEGAAGHRIAHVELTNTGPSPCGVRAIARPQLVDGRGSVLIDGANAPASELLTVASGGVLKTLVQDANYCGPAPQPPVSVAFVLEDGGRIVADAVSPTDATLPPCNGPGSPADIEMQPWAR